MERQRVVCTVAMVGLFAGLFVSAPGCGDDDGGGTSATSVAALSEVDLVSDQPGALTTDPQLLNAWGIALGATGIVWVAANHSGVSTLYNAGGESVAPAVTIPAPPGSTDPSAPTGMVFSGTADFAGDKFIFSTEDGTLAGWQTGTTAVLRVDNSGADAIYKGLALLRPASGGLLYATNFHAGRVEVFDQNYQPVALAASAFLDPALPQGFAPFNVAGINGQVYVTYAMQDENQEDDAKGPGRGYIDVFDTGGALLRRFASQGPLNSPWGLALVPPGFGAIGGDLLVGNFGDGRINVFNIDTGAFLGPVSNAGSGSPLTIDGLWALVFGPPSGAGGPAALFFSAGPDDETHGLFGRLDPTS